MLGNQKSKVYVLNVHNIDTMFPHSEEAEYQQMKPVEEPLWTFEG